MAKWFYLPIYCMQYGVNWLPFVLPFRRTCRNGLYEKVCNSINASDKSGQHGFQLWKAAVSLAQSGLPAVKYLNMHYWTNALKHGMTKPRKEEIDLIPYYQPEVARNCCANILREQINLLSPLIITATGKVAAAFLYDLRLISRPWKSFTRQFNQQIYSKKTLLPSGQPVTIYCSFHSATRAVNTHAAWKYIESVETQLKRWIEQLPDHSSAKWFLSKYPKEISEGRGMRVLFLHWLKIGEGIRQAALE